jgi:hypothetical protein
MGYQNNFKKNKRKAIFRIKGSLIKKIKKLAIMANFKNVFKK